ncbi:protein rep [Paenibacillus sp. N3/727]|uniref:protein rep n=1 Tax=Paenibacillus sp. N3/727 TaxID=2925845 RepID=UPI001F53CE6C|nr:protein rep [Paenibacillus sp. N3/727]UNK19156.1 protein rep [Paenibacillus sp. N3/727]
MSESWKRSLQYAFTNHRIISGINHDQQVTWLSLDLVLDQVPFNQINAELDHMLVAFNRLFKYKSVKQVALGYFRMLDVMQHGDLYQAKIHLLLPTLKSYFQGRYYLKYDAWLSLWRKALNCESDLRALVNVSVMSGKSDQRGIIRKMEFGLQQLHQELGCESAGFNGSLTGRRWIGYSRLLKEYMVPPKSITSSNMNFYNTEDSIANSAFESMVQWYPGVRNDANINPIFENIKLP